MNNINGSFSGYDWGMLFLMFWSVFLLLLAIAKWEEIVVFVKTRGTGTSVKVPSFARKGFESLKQWLVGRGITLQSLWERGKSLVWLLLAFVLAGFFAPWGSIVSFFGEYWRWGAWFLGAIFAYFVIRIIIRTARGRGWNLNQASQVVGNKKFVAMGIVLLAINGVVVWLLDDRFGILGILGMEAKFTVALLIVLTILIFTSPKKMSGLFVSTMVVMLIIYGILIAVGEGSSPSPSQNLVASSARSEPIKVKTVAVRTEPLIINTLPDIISNEYFGDWLNYASFECTSDVLYLYPNGSDTPIPITSRDRKLPKGLDIKSIRVSTPIMDVVVFKPR